MISLQAADPHPYLAPNTYSYSDVPLYVRDHQPFLIVSPPKCGTFLSAKVLTLLTLRTPALYLSDFRKDHESYKKVKSELASNRFVVTHEIHPEVVERLVQKGFKVIFVIRDPRDQLISVVNWVREGEWPWLAIAKMKNMDAQIQEAISGIQTGWKCFESCFLVYEKNIRDLPSESVLYVHYENLVGPQGGGSLESQLTEIAAIVDFIGLDITPQEQQDLLPQIFGGTATFRGGQIGSWKSHFTSTHKRLYKLLYKQELIRLGYEENDAW